MFSPSMSVAASESTLNSRKDVTFENPRHPVNCHNSVLFCDYMADIESPSSDSLDGLKTLKSKNLRNPFLLLLLSILIISYLNINHLGNKMIDLKHILQQIGLEYISLSETKLDERFPDTQFKIE